MTKNYFLCKDNLGLSFKNYFKREAGKLALLLIISVFSATVNAQVTVQSSGLMNLTYPSLADAITDLHTITISAPITITLTGNETAPAGGYSINVLGDATNLITLDGAGYTVTAFSPQTTGALNDAIFKLRGCAYVTIKGFVLKENPLNTTNETTAGTNNMTEWGVALLQYSPSRGTNNCTIENNTISLNKTYKNTFGIYSSNVHDDTAILGGSGATEFAGGNQGIKIYSNTISNVNIGIAAVGPNGADNQSLGLDIGGNSAATGNSITDFGFAPPTSSPSFSGLLRVNGIYLRNQISYNVSYNTITSSNVVGAGTLIGINHYANNATFNFPATTSTIKFNTIALKHNLAAAAVQGIAVGTLSGNVTTTINILNNKFKQHPDGLPTVDNGAIDFIKNENAAGTVSISNNTFENLAVKVGTGTTTLIWNSNNTPDSNIQNNAIVGSFTRNGTGAATMYGYYNNGSPTAGTSTISSNNFSNISIVGGTVALHVVRQTSTESQTSIVKDNIINNIASNGGNTVTGIWQGKAKAGSEVSGNKINTFNSNNVIDGLNLSVTTGGVECFNNEIYALKTSGASKISGIKNFSNTTTNNIYKNKIYNLEADNAAGLVDGVSIVGGLNVNVYNNIIGDLRTPSSSLSNPIVGINAIGVATSVIKVDYNTVVLNGASTGALFGSSALAVSATPTTPVLVRNNIFVNNSSVMGAGLAAAIRANDTTASKIDASSNNNLVYGSSIFTDGTNSDATLAAYKTRMSPRETAAISENPNFVSTTGTDATFLHINTGVATAIEGGGKVIGTTTDFDGDARNATTPDIGADEFSGVVLGFETFDSKSFVLYPTVVKGYVTITYSEKLTEAKVYNISGQQMFSKKINDTETQLEMSNLSKGIYFIQVSSGNTSKTIKVIKQ